ncbi:disease resistance protein (TIR-NBS-LRR class) putative [Euphorbia peplus]|nr:disease resistance protein (TIR-NBS-LRR class) putative [Euphorbia peplus]
MMSTTSSCIALPWKHEVFLSFNEQDTRKSFTSHLHAALHHKGINTFNQISGTITEISNAIEDSRISIVVFSKNYASCVSCLDQIAEIYECMKRKGQIVLPVFYGVDPSEVRKQSGGFGEFLKRHEEDLGGDGERVKKWRVAATGFANLSGWDLQNRDESKLIEEIVEEVVKKLRKSSPKLHSNEANNLVGINSRLEEMMNLCIEEGKLNNSVEFVGICGMGGIGKTTIARALYGQLSNQFEGCCFLANVREVESKFGLISLQQQLLSETLMETDVKKVWNTHSGMDEIKNRLRRKRVLIVLDDVSGSEQLKSLAGMHDWFGCGSRIIVTTRDEHLLVSHGVEKIYRVEGLNHDESFSLFCLKAFKSDYPDYDYVEIANRFVSYANGLPLALDILGCFLFGKSIDEWESALERLMEIPNKQILDKLRISFDGLQEVEKKIFLDIACFFKGEEKDYVVKVLESCGFYPEIGIKVLLSKSLITICNDRICMHDLLEEMGREIVRTSCYEEPGRRSRLWLYKDVYHVLSNDTGTEEVEGIVLDTCEQEDDHLSAKAFTKMRNLRLLKLGNLRLSGSLNYLSNELRYLDWEEYPFKSFPSTFQPDKLVELHLPSSNIQQLWKGIKPLKMLKVIDLSFSINLIKTMDFEQVPNLEKLNLEGCIRLYEIHRSIGALGRLVELNLKDCKSLVRLPNTICGLNHLKVLNLHGCSKLDELPPKLAQMTCLEKLNIGGIASKQVTTTNFLLLSWLIPKRSLNLPAFLPSLSVLCSLRSLNLSYCNLGEGVLPKDLSCFPLLQSLNLCGNNIISLPESISRLANLEDFRVDNCRRLNALPDLPSSILYLSTVGCSSLATSLPNTISRHYELENLQFPDCERLQTQPDLSSAVIRLSVEGLSADDDPKHSALTFVNRIQLVEIKGKNSTAFSRLTSYLHYLLKHSSQGLYSPSSHVSMCLAGNEVPQWFNYQGIGCSIELQLPPHWFTNRWMGFAICVLLEAYDDQRLSTENNTVFCDLQAWNDKADEAVFLGRPATQVPAEMGSLQDHLWFNFMPSSSLNCENWWDKCGNLRATFHSNGLKVKYCGLKIIYDLDVAELIQCHRPAELFDVSDVDMNVCDKSKRRHGGDDDSCCEFVDGPNPKRLKM